jgi:hypothetical protein
MDNFYNTEMIPFADLSPESKQQCVNYLWKGLHRHLADIRQIERDLQVAKQDFGIEPQDIYINKWIEV